MVYLYKNPGPNSIILIETKKKCHDRSDKAVGKFLSYIFFTFKGQKSTYTLQEIKIMGL